MTWTLTVDVRTTRITDTDQVMVSKLLDRLGSAGMKFSWTASDGTEIPVTSNSHVSLTHDSD